MPLRARVYSIWRNIANRNRVERDLDDELRSLFELLVEEKLRSGMSAQAARRSALFELDGMESVKERVRETQSGAWLDALRRDVRFALRVLARGRLFTATAVMTLALGIGANAAIFSLVNGLLLQPLPYPHADRLVWITSSAITGDNLAAWRDGMRSFERMSAFELHSSVLTGVGPAERLDGMLVTEDFLPLLGGVPVLGRLWTADEHRSGAAPTVVVSHRLWTRLGSGGTISNTSITLDGKSYTVIGVLDAGFADLHYESDVWFPAAGVGERFSIIGLRRRSVSLNAVKAEATTLGERLAVTTDQPRRPANVITLTQFFKSETRTPLLVLYAAAGLVLLIACVNVANLLLSRAAGREREMAVRVSLGASQATLLRQLLTESTVLALAGGAVGWMLAMIGLRAVLAVVPTSYAWGRITTVHMDQTVHAYTFLVALIATLLAGLAPAISAAQRAASATAVGARASATRGARRAREVLMTAEIALTLVLLIGTLLLIRTFLVLRPASPGFELRDRMVASVRLPEGDGRDDVAIAEFARRLLEELRVAAPGARVAIATDVPMSGSILNFRVVNVDGVAPTPAPGTRASVDIVSATPNYFEILGMRMVRGRILSEPDNESHVWPGPPVAAVLNESAARRFWGKAEAIGRRFVLGMGQRQVELVVVGIAADTRGSGNNTNARATAFVSFWQLPWAGFEVVVHQPGAVSVTDETVRNIIASLDPRVPVGTVTTLQQITSRAVAEPRYHMTLMTVFAALALILALVGCYGVLGYSVAQRTREIGVRVALGASRGAIIRGVVAHGALLIAIGLAIGTVLALAATRLLEGSLYGVTPTDPVTFMAAGAGLALVALIAAYLPARKAAAVQPIQALRVD
jgi:putative ABC transport system permease protein